MAQVAETTGFTVIVISPDGELYRSQAVSVIVPAVDGYLGILKGHAPMIAAMAIGELLIRTPDEHILSLAVAGGIVEVRRTETLILCDHAEFREDIDVARASHAEERARERMSERFEDMDVARASVALAKARNRLRIAQRGERKKLID
jgi:F-type H+-transporting ATPase subunit epsilon